MAQATITARVDDQFQLFVNGALVIRGGSWLDVESAVVDLAPGDVIAVRGVDFAWIAGAFVDIRFADGTKLGSSTDWRVTTTDPGAAWTQKTFDDSAWDQATAYGGYATDPWTQTSSSEPLMPADSVGAWIWSADPFDDNAVWLRFTIPGPTSPNQQPTLDAPLADQTATEDAPFSFVVPANAFSDPDGDALT